MPQMLNRTVYIQLPWAKVHTVNYIVTRTQIKRQRKQQASKQVN